MSSKNSMYQMFLVKPYFKEGVKHFSYTNIGIAFKKEGGTTIDMKLEVFPILGDGSFIQLRPMVRD